MLGSFQVKALVLWASELQGLEFMGLAWSFGVSGLFFRVWGLGLRVEGLGFGVEA